MKKKNVYLTLWLIFPIVIVTSLIGWIFYSLDKDRLMADAVPYGAGAGDTGNANALGQWLAGRDPDEVSIALKARRHGYALSPGDWPGGVMVKIPVSAFGEDARSAMLVFVDDQSLEVLAQAMVSDDAGFVTLELSHADAQGFFFYASTTEPTLQGNKIVDASGRVLRPIEFGLQIPDPDLQVSEPMTVEVRIDSVYEDPP